MPRPDLALMCAARASAPRGPRRTVALAAAAALAALAALAACVALALAAALAACGAPAAAPTAHVAVPTEAPRPDDVGSIDGIMRAFYEVVDVAPDAPRQWGRDRTLYAPWIRFVGLGRAVDVYDHQRLVDETEPMIRAGFRERELRREVLRYGDLAQVRSTYESRRGSGEISRGVNALELYFDGHRWWIASVAWQIESAAHPIPPELLPAADGPAAAPAP